MTPRVLIIGYGNLLRGDDGVGWRAAEHLSHELSGEEVEVLACHQLTPELVERVSQAETVIFIDASVGSSPWRISCTPVEPETAPRVDFLHHLNPSTLVGWSRRLYDSSPQAFFLSVCGESFELGEGLSPVVSSALPELVRKARRLAFPHGLPRKTQIESCDGVRAGLLENSPVNEVERHGDRNHEPRKDRQG